MVPSASVTAARPGPKLVGLDLLAHREADAGRGQGFLQHGAIEVAVLDHVGGRPALHVVRPELQQHGAGIARPCAVGDDDVGHGLGFVGHRLPDAERLEHAARGGGDGGGTAIEAVAGEAARVLRIDHDHVERALCAPPAKGQGRRQARSGLRR